MQDKRVQAEQRLAEIREQARKRGLILLRCPKCRHYLTGILSLRGDFRHKDGTRSNLYCTWPDCTDYTKWVPVAKAVRGQAPKDETVCCVPVRRSGKLKAKKRRRLKSRT